jgi:hypothetical protein
MAILKEWRCLGHGPFENFDGKCPKGCPSSLVQREIRTAPAYERGNKKFIDRQMDLLAADHGLTDIRSGDAQSGTSALQVMQSKKKTEHKPEWIDIPHAAAGFSKSGDAAPVFNPSSMGMVPSPKAAETIKSLPKPRPNIVGSYRG